MPKETCLFRLYTSLSSHNALRCDFVQTHFSHKTILVLKQVTQYCCVLIQALTPTLLLFFPNTWFMVFPFLTKEFQGMRAVLASTFLKADRGSAVMAAAVTLPYFSLALSKGLLTHSHYWEHFLSSMLCFILSFLLEKFDWIGNAGGLSTVWL